VKPSLDDLYLFAEIARSGGLIRGAKRLGLPKSTVSRRLAALERDVGAKLLDRDARHFALTDIGRAYAEQAAPMVEAYGEAQDFISHREARPRGVLKIAMPADFAIFYMADALASFFSSFPAVTLVIEASPEHADIVGERFDLAIRMGDLPDSSLIASPLLQMTRHFYASKGLLEKTGTPRTLAELQDFPFVSLQTQAPVVRSLRFPTAAGEVVFTPSTVIRTNSIGLVRKLVQAGAGAALLPDGMADGNMTRLLGDVEPPPIRAHFLLPQKKWLPLKTRVFVDHVHAHFASGLAKVLA
jgi:DNA-binding transcriptional LysR family regulator